MTFDIGLTVLNVVFGLILSGIGIEMVNNPPDTKTKKWVYRTLFSVFGIAVVITTFIQSTSNAKRQEQERGGYLHDQAEMREKLGTANGKLDAIASFQTQFIDFVSKHPSGGSSDEAVKAMAGAVLRMAQPGVPRPTGAIDVCLALVPTPQQLQSMSNSDLKKYAGHVAKEIDEFDQEWVNWPDRPEIDDQDPPAVRLECSNVLRTTI